MCCRVKRVFTTITARAHTPRRFAAAFDNALQKLLEDRRWSRAVLVAGRKDIDCGEGRATILA
jgi:hypothetical protein